MHTDTYTYGDANWKDKLTAFNGKTITYDAIGNPLKDNTWTYTWGKGRQLQYMVKNGDAVYFYYNEDGVRLQKTATGTTGVTKYSLHGKNIVHLTNAKNNLHFFYDARNKPAVVTFNGTAYAYLYNLQGDVIALIDSNGKKVVEYKYDAWGRILSKTGTMASTLGTLNPFRYRGYVYDEETGLYYLRSRYYNPEWARFLNADIIWGIVGKVFSHNGYTYCSNSPALKYDPSGYSAVDAALFFQEASAADGPFPYGDIVGVIGAIIILLFGTKQTISQTSTSTNIQEKAREKKSPTYIYRRGSSTFRNLTPRAFDDALSFSLTPPSDGKAFRTTMEAVNATGVLVAINDHDDYVSVMPIDYSTMEEWRNTRETANEAPHAYTILLSTLSQ